MNDDSLILRRRDTFDARFDPRLEVGDLHAVATAHGDAALLTQVEITLASVHIVRSELADADRFAQAALGRLGDLDVDTWEQPERILIGVLYNSLGNLALCRGDFDEARHWYVTSLRDNVGLAESSAASMNWLNVGLAELSMGNLATSADYHSRILGWPVESPRALGAAKVGLARVALCETRHREAADLMDSVHSAADQARMWDRQYLIMGRLRSALAGGDVATAVAIADEVGETTQLLPELTALRAWAVFHAGDLDRAERILDGDERLRSPNHRWNLGSVHACRAAIAIARGRLDEARRLLTGIDESFVRFEDRVVLDQQREALALAEGDYRAAFEVLTDRISAVAQARHVAVIPELAPDVERDTAPSWEREELSSELEQGFERLRLGRLEEVFRQRRELLGIVAHDLRGPLMNVQLSLDLLARTEPGEPESRTPIVAIRRSVDSMRSVVDVLSLLAEVDDWTTAGVSNSGHSTARPESALALVESVVDETSPWARQHQQSIEVTDLTGATALIDGDPRLFKIVLSNLLSNAIKYSADGSDIDVRLSEASDSVGLPWVRVEVEDHGQGMDAELLERVWRRYVRSRRSPRPGQPSLGLGLYIARALTDRMHGKLTVRSQPGVGSTFTLDLPPARRLAEASEPAG